MTGVHDVCKRKRTSVMPGDEVLENRSYFLIFAHRCSGFRSFFFLKTHARHRNKWLESWPSMLKSAQTWARQRWEEGKPTRKGAHQVERNVWFSSTDEQFEGITRNARKKGILHGTTLWSLAAVKWAPKRLSRCLICIQILVVSDFFKILAQKCLGFRSDF